VLAAGISFTNYKPHLDTGEPYVFGTNCWDTGEYLFEALGRESVVLLPVERSENGWGDVIDSVVYHHRAMTGYDASGTAPTPEAALGERRLLWHEAVRMYAPNDRTL
jgi:hypothetical protein